MGFRRSQYLAVMLCAVAIVNSITIGYDTSMANGFNILPQYLDYFSINTATLSLGVAMPSVGAAVLALPSGSIVDRIGRKNSIYLGSGIILLGTTLQTAAQNFTTFAIGRFFIGGGCGIGYVAGPAYLIETALPSQRIYLAALLNDFFYVGAIIAAVVTYGTQYLDSSWAWRVPSVLQSVPAVIAIVIMPFLPESPRHLYYHGRQQDALSVLIKYHGDGVQTEKVDIQYAEIKEAREHEAEQQSGWTDLVKSPANRKRLIIAVSFGIFCQLWGNNIATYYLGELLTGAGIDNPHTQLIINIVLSVWNFFCAMGGTAFVEKLGRRTLINSSNILMVITMFMIGALIKYYSDGSNLAGSYGTVAIIFIFYGSYSFAWTPLLTAYPPEVLSFPMRAKGLAALLFAEYAAGVFVAFVIPFGITAIGWEFYMINGVWNVLQAVFCWWYYPETKGFSLEEVQLIFDPDDAELIETRARRLSTEKHLDNKNRQLEKA